MSILIKGVEMPKDCPMCPMSYWTKGNCEFSGCAIVNGKRYARYEDEKYANSYGRPSWCPLIELPPHGRLIDADELIRQMNQKVEETNNVRYAWVNEMDISLADTIIEAEDKDD